LNSNSILREELQKVYNCIKNYLQIDVSDVPIVYMNSYDYYRCIKTNVTSALQFHKKPEFLNELYMFYCECVSGLYKRREKRVVIKEESKNDSALLLVELLHAKSIIQNYKITEDWINEGLTHYIAKILCEKCKILYKESGHQKYFTIWEKIYQKYGLDLLKNIIFAEDIKITQKILKLLLNYKRNDVLELSFEKAKALLYSVI